MEQLLFQHIRDPLYRLAIWLILCQVVFIITAIIFAATIRWLKPKFDEQRQEEEQQARGVLLNLLSEVTPTDEQALELIKSISIRSVITAYEQVVTRIGMNAQRTLRGSVIALGIESYALKLTYSWFWWRRSEGVQLLRSVGAAPAEERLVSLLNDKHVSVSFYAAWALARVASDRGMIEIPRYLSEAPMLSYSQQVTLFRELQIELLTLTEQQTFYNQLSVNLRPIFIEALILSGRTLALPFVRVAIYSEDDEVRISAYKAAATSRLALREDELKRGLSDRAWPVRAQAAKAVGMTKMINLVPDLCKTLADSQWWVRYNSACSLAGLGSVGVEALMYVSQASEDRFARDVSRMILSEVIMGTNTQVTDGLDTQPISPLPQRVYAEQTEAAPIHERPNSLLTAEVSILSELDD